MTAQETGADGARGIVLELLDAVRAGGLLETGRPVVVMLSGGRDSTCLLDVAVSVAGVAAVSALHVNYGLREQADADQRHCVSLCEQLGVALDVERAAPAPVAGNVQAWARELRYDAAARLARSRGADVAAGHTATDQVETILYRLASSPSRRALLGMRAREGNLIRPLLGFSREQTGDYCRARSLRWCEDESNDSDRYARGRVRNELVPALRRIHPGAERNLLAVAEVLRAEADVLDLLVDRELGGSRQLTLARLRELPTALARLLVQRLADDVAGRPMPGTARRLEDLLALSESGTAHLDLPAGVRASAVNGMLSFGRTPAIEREP